MAAITAAAISAAVAIGTTAYSAVSANQGGGSGSNPQFKRLPADPHDRAMKEYMGRLAVANLETQRPSFRGYLAAEGAPESTQWDLEMPGMKPSEATALGFTGVRGEKVPFYDVRERPEKLTPEQALYAAKERQRRAKSSGQEVGPWATQVVNTDRALRRITERKAKLEGQPGQERQLEKLSAREERLRERQAKRLGG